MFFIINQKNLKTLNIIIGLLAIISSIFILLFTLSAVLGLLLILAFTLLFIGIARLSNAFWNELLSTKAKIIKASVGLISIVMSLILILVIVLYPATLILILIYIFSIILFIIGIDRCFIGYITKSYISWYRVLLIIIGVITVVLSTLIFVIPIYDVRLFISLLSISVLLNGLARVILGLKDIEKKR